jgi:hypothetical protein
LYGFIKLPPEHGQSHETRLGLLTREQAEMLQAMRRKFPAVKVFT